MAFIGLFEVFLAVICFFILHYLANNINNDLPMNFPLVEGSQCTFLFKGPWFAEMDTFVTTHPPNIYHIMSSNFSNFPKSPKFNQIFDVLGDAISNSNSDFWKNQRKAALALINNQSFYQFLLKTSRDEVENGMIPILEHVPKKGIYVDLQDLVQRYTFDSTCILVTAYDPGCLSIEFPEILEEKKMKRAKKILDQTIVGYIQGKREELNQEIGLNKQVELEGPYLCQCF
ncbi:hypothetical protein ACOSQ4_022360 [Xanthoceras sorbifolium]